MCSFVESCLLRLILDSADSAMGVDKGGQEADTVRGSVEKQGTPKLKTPQNSKFLKNSKKLVRGDSRQIR